MNGRVTTAELLAVGSSGACAFLDLYATQPLLPTFERVFQASKATASLTVSASTVAVALAAPLVGPAADRLGRKTVMHDSADTGTRDVFNGARARAARAVCPERIWPVARRKLEDLDAANVVSD